MSVLWLTGLSGSGKSTIAENLVKSIDAQIVDGDVIRSTISSDLKHGAVDRKENQRRVIRYIKNNLSKSKFTIATFVSPDKSEREWLMTEFRKDDITFYEIYVKASIEACEKRDPKSLYALYRKGQNVSLAGLTECYDEPENPSIVCNTELDTIEDCVRQITELITR